jgi:hypothetical protein
MKLVKMSLAAALLVSGAYALDNVKVNGSAKLIYQTTDVTGTANNSLFGKINAAGGAQVLLGATADLVDNISAGAEVQVFSTLGLENNMVDGVMATGSASDAYNMSQMWMAASYGKTTAKVGRMELDTPLAFTEKWNVAKNTFEAAVAINQDIENTTLVGAYVGKHNGLGGGQTAALEGNIDTNATVGTANYQIDGGSSAFTSFYGGAYAFGVVNSSVENTTLQAWYYNINGEGTTTNRDRSNTLASTLNDSNLSIDGVQAFWLQADVKDVAGMINIGVQYANIDANVYNNQTGINANLKDSNVWAVKVDGSVSDVNLFAAYSSTDKDGTLSFANTATGDKSKVYTATGSIYMDGAVVTAPGIDAWKVGASTNVAGYDLAANYTTCDADAANADVDGYDVSVGTKVGAIALKAIYTSIDSDANAVAPTDRDTLRVIASVKF